jgi:hypothetical protein
MTDDECLLYVNYFNIFASEPSLHRFIATKNVSISLGCWLCMPPDPPYLERQNQNGIHLPGKYLLLS